MSSAQPLRVLIVKTSSMGDIVHALPVVHDMLAAHPGAQIDWLVEEAYADIVRAHPGVHRVIPLALRRWRRQFWRADIRAEWHAWKAQLRAESYDAVIDLQGLVKSALIARLARGPLYGLSWGSAREALAPLFYRHRQETALHRTEAAVPRYRALVAWALGYTPQGQPRYGLHLQAARPDWLPGEAPYVVLLSATAKDRKLWDEARWIALGQALAAQGKLCVFAWGNAAERARAERLAVAVQGGAAASAASVGAEDPPPGRPKAGLAPSGGSAAASAASVGAEDPPPGRPKAGLAPSGGSAAASAASVGAEDPPPGRPKAGLAPSGGSAAALAASVGASFTSAGALPAPAAFGLAEWMRVLRAANVVVGVDTGLLYLAAAVGTPAVAIYTGSSPHSVEFESAGPWRSLGDRGQQPAVEAVLAATRAVLAADRRGTDMQPA